MLEMPGTRHHSANSNILYHTPTTISINKPVDEAASAPPYRFAASLSPTRTGAAYRSINYISRASFLIYRYVTGSTNRPWGSTSGPRRALSTRAFAAIATDRKSSTEALVAVSSGARNHLGIKTLLHKKRLYRHRDKILFPPSASGTCGSEVRPGAVSFPLVPHYFLNKNEIFPAAAAAAASASITRLEAARGHPRPRRSRPLQRADNVGVILPFQ
ncbi:hypothetical protein EVAR_42689_1 [Eumeta japonica]|uniref:Uncharacterized protein n=1 Tax=Eumeta variegata TaxID=151549 RepID=A0A4C1X2E8_EUMVA|nr:hypothetical protein EVAR_42689_1 [Eumeta japonica]